jgi:hypothetical protein
MPNKDDKIKEELELVMTREGYTKIMTIHYYSRNASICDYYIDHDGDNSMILYGKPVGNITIYKIGKCFLDDFKVYDINKIGNKEIYIKETNRTVQINAIISVDKYLKFYFNFIY